MADGHLPSGSDAKKNFKSEKEKKHQREVAERLIRNARTSPRSYVQDKGRYLAFGASQLEKEVLEIYKERKDKAKKFLKAFDGKLTISYDRLVHDKEYWDSESEDGSVYNDDFVCVSAHFVDCDWNIRKWILEYLPIEFGPVEEVSVDRFKKVIVDYEIENKVSTLLVPNSGDVSVEAFDAFREWIEERGENLTNPCFFRIYCCADLFRLMAGDVFGNMDLLLEEIRVLVGWGKLTSTNWNVSLGNLQDALDMEDKRVFVEDGYYEGWDLPNDDDWILIRTFCKLAGCIYKVAKELFEGDYSTSNVYFHLLAELKVMLNQELASADDDDFRDKAKKILERFDKYWNDMFLVLATASVLDPRFKIKYLEFYCSNSQVCDEGSNAEIVLDHLCNLYAQYAANDIGPQAESPNAAIDSLSYTSDEEDDEGDDEEESDYECGEEEQDKEKKHDAYEDFVLFQEFLKFEGSSREFMESELDSYLKEPVMEWNKDFKALDWWSKESQKYPILSRVARDILSIPISRATSYYAYVANERECPKFVVSMEAELVNAMMCSKKWSRL